MAFNQADSQTVLIKLEVTEGLDPTPTPAADAVEIFGIKVTPTSDTITQTPNKTFFVNDKVSYPNKRYDISFDFYMTGAGSTALAAGTPPPYNVIMLTAGHAGVGSAAVDYRYLPVTGSANSSTIYFWQDKVLMKAHALKGSITDKMIIGDVRLASFKGTALYVSPVDNTISGTPDFSAFRQSLEDGEPESICMVHGVEVHGRSYSFDQNSTNEFYETTKVKRVVNTNRQAKGTLVVALETLADFNSYALWESEAGGEIYWETGVTPGDIVRISHPNAQVAVPDNAGDKGVTQQSFEIIPHPTPTGVDDEYVYIIK
jgi:hypothetical protein